jgi:NAD(P)-dependent dehydrogenase (short-subunit alcohol dehydrogenase family)
MDSIGIEHFFDFNGKVVLVTGAAKGIGRGIALRFAQAGAHVAVHYHTNQQKAHQVVDQVQASGVKSAALQADLTRVEEVKGLVSEVIRLFGGVDILVNNAGTYPVTPFLEMPPAEWEKVVAENLHSVFYCTQEVSHWMIQNQRPGVVINIASIEASFPAFGHSHYNAAKAGVLHFTRSTARELAKYGIRINCISPGLINSPGLEEAWSQGVNAWRQSAPLERLGEPEDIADACLFLASPAARWITGIDLVVDGGASTTPAF